MFLNCLSKSIQETASVEAAASSLDQHMAQPPGGRPQGDPHPGGTLTPGGPSPRGDPHPGSRGDPLPRGTLTPGGPSPREDPLPGPGGTLSPGGPSPREDPLPGVLLTDRQHRDVCLRRGCFALISRRVFDAQEQEVTSTVQ